MEEKTHRTIAGYLSLINGVLFIIAALFAPLLFLYLDEQESYVTKSGLSQASFLIIDTLMVLYCGYWGYVSFKNKNKLLYYNSILLLSQIPIIIIETFFQIFYFDLYKGFYDGKLSLYWIIISSIIFGISFIVNGKYLLKDLKLPSNKKIFGKSRYFLLIAFISMLAMLIVSFYDSYLWSELSNQASIDLDREGFFNDEIYFVSLLLVFVFFNSLIIGLFMLLFRFIKYLNKKKMKNENKIAFEKVSKYYCTKCGNEVGGGDINCKKCKSLLAINGAVKIKKAKIKKEIGFQFGRNLKKWFTTVNLWKLVLYANLIGGLLFYINLIFKPFSYLAGYTGSITLNDKILMALIIIFPVVILYGLYKKLRIAYDMSLVFILVGIIKNVFDIEFFWRDSIYISSIVFNLTSIVVLILIGYWIYNERADFGVK